MDEINLVEHLIQLEDVSYLLILKGKAFTVFKYYLMLQFGYWLIFDRDMLITFVLERHVVNRILLMLVVSIAIGAYMSWGEYKDLKPSTIVTKNASYAGYDYTRNKENREKEDYYTYMENNPDYFGGNVEKQREEFDKTVQNYKEVIQRKIKMKKMQGN